MKLASIILLLTLALGVNCQDIAAQQDEQIPDTPIGKRLSNLIELLNEADETKRNQMVVDNLKVEDTPTENLQQIAGQIHKQLNGVTFGRITRAKENRISAVCTTGTGMAIKISIELTDDEMIGDIDISPYSGEQTLKAVDGFTPVVGEDEKTFPPARGVWLAKGYGYVLHVTDDELQLYNYSGKFGWKGEFDENMLIKINEDKKSARATFHILELGYRLTRLDKLPETCQKTEWSNTEVFNAFTDVMSTYYPFFGVRNVNWNERIESARDLVTDEMSDAELFEVMAATLKNLNDGHVSFSATIDGKRRRAEVTSTPIEKLLATAFEDQPKKGAHTSQRNFQNAFRFDIKEQIDEAMIGPSGDEWAGKLKWGRLNSKVGYLFIDGMYGAGAGSIDEQVADLHNSLNKILKALADTDSLIIDVTLNPGGTDYISTEIAAHFADKKRVGFSKWPATVEAYRNDRSVTPYSETSDDAVMYTKPVYLMTTDYTASAAEIFTMCMRSYPHVTTVGTPTSGALSDILDKSLPNGWDLAISNEVYVDHEGVCHEGKGVPPEIKLPIFVSAESLVANHLAAIEKVVEIALKNAGQ